MSEDKDGGGDDDEVEEVTRRFGSVMSLRVKVCPQPGSIPYPTESELKLWRDCVAVSEDRLAAGLFDQRYAVVTPFDSLTKISIFVEYFAANINKIWEEKQFEKEGRLLGRVALSIFDVSAYDLCQLFVVLVKRWLLKLYAINAFTHNGKERGMYDINTPSWEHRWSCVTECEGGCGVQGVTLHPCSKCKCAVYCGKECQKRAWPEHKVVCGFLNDFRAKK